MTLPANAIGGMKIRTGRKGRRIDYYEIDWKRKFAHALKLVQIGPAIGAEQRRPVVANALKRAKLSADVTDSAIPPIDR